MAITYILFSESLDKYYVGHTEQSMEERLRRHLSDHKGFSAKAKDWRIVFTKEFPEKKEAAAFERQIKAWKSRSRMERLIAGA